MGVGGRQRRDGDGRAVDAAHDALREKEVAHEASDENIVAKVTQKGGCGQGGPGNRVSDGRQQPVHVPSHRAPVRRHPRNVLEHLLCDAGQQCIAACDEDPQQRRLHRSGQARGKEIGRQLRVRRQQLAARRCAQPDAVVKQLHGRRGRAAAFGGHAGGLDAAGLGEGSKGSEHGLGRGTVEDEERGAADPAEQIGEGDGQILGEVCVVKPQLGLRRRLGYTVAVVVKQRKLILGATTQRTTKTFDGIRGGIVGLLALELGLPAQKLLLEAVGNHLDSFVLGHQHGVEPALFARAGVCVNNIWRGHANVQAEHKASALHFHFSIF
eukprot:m.62561 g.62561  ORF g.62561 m.62561 type:complete len:325 (-) comp12414_c1_seq1:93-1067(-)